MNILKKVVTHCIYSQGLLSPRKERSLDICLLKFEGELARFRKRKDAEDYARYRLALD
jgi:hypothetical protein